MRKISIIVFALLMVAFINNAAAKQVSFTYTYFPDQNAAASPKLLEEATRETVRAMLEQEIGSQITSKLSREMEETQANGKADFRQQLNSQLTSDVTAYVKSKKVISQEWVTQSGLKGIKTIMEADIYEDRLAAKMEELLALRGRAGKMVVIMQEIQVDTAGNRTVNGNSQIAVSLASELGQKGFDLVCAQDAAKVQSRDVAAFAAFMANKNEMSKLAVRCGADVVLFGTNEIVDKGVISGAAITSLNGQVRYEMLANVSVVQASTGEVLANNSFNMSTMGINGERAIKRALTGKGDNYIQKLLKVTEGIDLKLKDREQNGTSYVIVVKKVTNYRKLGAEFVAAMNELVAGGQLKQAAEQSFNRDRGELVVEVRGTQDLETLKNVIFSACDKHAVLGNIDLVTSTGHKIILTL